VTGFNADLVMACAALITFLSALTALWPKTWKPVPRHVAALGTVVWGVNALAFALTPRAPWEATALCAAAALMTGNECLAGRKKGNREQ